MVFLFFNVLLDRNIHPKVPSDLFQNVLGHCVVPESIHCPTKEGLYARPQPPSPGISIFRAQKSPLPHPLGISISIVYTPDTLWKNLFLQEHVFKL